MSGKANTINKNGIAITTSMVNILDLLKYSSRLSVAFFR
jgi:hypothetical protein